MVAGSIGEASANGVLYENGRLFAGQGLVAAPGCYVHLDMQADGNLVLRYGGDVAWASNTKDTGAYAVMQDDGNFVIYNWDNKAVWATNTAYWADNYLLVQDDGNLVVREWNTDPQWASNTWVGESVGQTPCEREESTTYAELNVNRNGGDYESRQIVGRNWPEACEYWCAEDSRCVAFTHVPMGIQGPNAVCWLKDSVPAATGATGFTSGVVNRSY